MLSHVSRLNHRWALCRSSCCIHSRMIPLAFSQLITVVTVGWVWETGPVFKSSERMKTKLQNSSYCSTSWHLPCLRTRSAVSHQTLMLQQYRADADTMSASPACKEKEATKNVDFLFLNSFHVMWLSDSTTNANWYGNTTKYNLTLS